MPNKRIFTDIQKQNIVKFYIDNHTASETCKFFNLRIYMLKNILNEKNIQIRSTRENHELSIKNKKQKYKENILNLTDKKIDEIINYYNAPNTIRQTARKFNLDHNYLRRLFKDFNVKLHGASIVKQLSNEKMKNTCLELYGTEASSQSETIQNKMKATCIQRYGAEWSLSSETIKAKIKNTVKEKYGVENLLQNKSILNKVLETKQRNSALNTSSAEERCYGLLLANFDATDVIRNYRKDSRYPFMCDFYIKSKDLFIECNFHWTHGYHKYDENCLADLQIVEKWRAKNTKYYDNAIATWTIRDVKKYNTAMQNALNYIVFYSEKDFISWISSINADKLYKI